MRLAPKLKNAKKIIENDFIRDDTHINYTSKKFSFIEEEDIVLYELIQNFYNVDKINNSNNDNTFEYWFITNILNPFDIDEAGNYIIRALDAEYFDKPDIYNDKNGYIKNGLYN